MQSWRVKILFVFLVAGFAMTTANAQLLQDINKLKTEKRKARGFNFFRKHDKKNNQKVIKSRTPKTASGAISSKTLRVSPKFSQSVRVSNKGNRVRPKFSRVISVKGGIISPKFSKDIAGKGSDRVINPKFTRDIAGKGGNRNATPRYSKDPGNMGSYIAPKPRSVSGKGMVFSFPTIQHYMKRPKNHGEYDWDSPRVPKKIKKKGVSLHPSFAHLSAKYNTSGLVRGGLQKFNILWVRVNGNKSFAKGVKRKSKKLKFDKDEKDIWNNKEREYTHN